MSHPILKKGTRVAIKIAHFRLLVILRSDMNLESEVVVQQNRSKAAEQLESVPVLKQTNQ